MLLQTVLDALYQANDISFSQATEVFEQVMRGELSESEITALLISLKCKGETASEIAGAANAMVTHARAFTRPDYPFADIVGTGGDGHNTINISSAAAVVAASCGVPVAKHGNRSVSSKSGSADLFKAFGVELMLSPQSARTCLDETQLAFLFAPVYHAGVKHVMPVRTQLKTRTIFNVLGPLANPARPSHSVLGVYTDTLLEPYAQTMDMLGHKNAWIVYGDGLDELSCQGVNQVLMLKEGKTERVELTAADFGLPRHQITDLVGGEPAENRQAIADVFMGQGQAAHEDAIAMNTAAVLLLTEQVTDLKAGVSMAKEAMANGKPMQIINQLAQLSQTMETV